MKNSPYHVKYKIIKRSNTTTGGRTNSRRPVARAALFVPVALSKVVFYGDGVLLVLLVLIVVPLAMYFGRRRGWKKLRTSATGLLLTFAVVVIYSFFVDVPTIYADRASSDPNLIAEKVFFIYEDHIGRPVRMTEYSDYDSDGSLERNNNGNNYPYWKANYTPFGQVYDDFNSTGITVGSGSYSISWMPPFRFPGQYSDPELSDKLFYNHFRWYLPEMGRYTSADAMDFHDGQSKFIYADANPVKYIDFLGLYKSCISGICLSGPTHSSILRQMNPKCNNSELEKGIEKPDQLFNRDSNNRKTCPKGGDPEAKKYWHFANPEDVIKDLDALLEKKSCDPIIYGEQLHRLMDSHSHYLKWGPGGPKEIRHPKSTKWPGGGVSKRSPDAFLPEINDPWGYIDFDMRGYLDWYVDRYNNTCCN